MSSPPFTLLQDEYACNDQFINEPLNTKEEPVNQALEEIKYAEEAFKKLADEDPTNHWATLHAQVYRSARRAAELAIKAIEEAKNS